MSNNLDLSQIAGTQLNKHVTANDQAGELDAAITEVMPVPVDGTNAVTLTAAEFRRHFLFEVADDTVGDLDMFDAQDLSFTPQTVHAVQISWRARKDDAAIREVRSRIRSAAATANGTTRNLTSSYLYYHDVFEEDPDAGPGAWTGAAVAAMAIGVETVT